jgi:hypothetical protein
MNKFNFNKLTPFKWFVLENFPFLEADFDALTEVQLFYKLGKEINKIIDSQNVVGTEMEKFSQAFIELQNYVNDYFKNLDVQEEINNKLNEMASDGTLAKIIEDYATIPELTNRVEKLEDQSLIFQKNERNSKYIAYIFCDNEYRQSINYITELLTRCANAGFKESQMTIHINDDGTLTENKTKFTEYNNIANSLNIPITSVKFHGNYNAINYQNTVLDVLTYFPNATTVFVLNEQLDKVFEYGLGYPAVIKNNFPNIKKVGFTCVYNQAFYGNNVTPTQWESIINVYDVLGVHMYPSVSSFSNPSNCSYDKVINAFNNPTFICPWTKEIWITESGVLPYWQMLELPENYRLNVLTDKTFNTEPQKIFFRALNNCNMAQRATKVIPWFLESGMSDTKHELFDILENIIKNR